MDFFSDFGLGDTFQKGIVPNSLQIDQDKLHMKFSALNVDFNGPSLDFLGSMKHAQEGIKAVSYTHLTLPTNREV